MDMQKDIYIWGTGNGFELVCASLKKNIKIKGCIDINKEKQGKSKYGLRIYSPEEVDLKNELVIISVKEYKNIEKELLKRGCKSDNICIYWKKIEQQFQNIISEEKRKEMLEPYEQENQVINNGNERTEKGIKKITKIINNIYLSLSNREIVLFGKEELCKDFISKLEDNVQERVWGVIDLDNEKNELKELKYRDINELYLETTKELDFFILHPKMTKKYISILIDMGFDQSQIIGVGEDLFCGTQKQDVYDIQLGYSRINDLPGFIILGNKEDETAYRIVTLGGSTTDPTLCNIKSWSEFLFEQLRNMGLNVCIYVGGMASYTVSQELQKLIRDVVGLKPHMVLSYSGINDAVGNYYDKGYPFIINYQWELFNKVAENKMIYNTLQRDIPIEKVSKGLKNNEDNSKHWLKCQRMMYAICKEFGIIYRGVLQPYSISWSAAISKETREYIEMFYRQLLKEIKIDTYTDWLADFTDIFDEEENIFFDICHVYEKGNRIIARKMMKIVLEGMDR